MFFSLYGYGYGYDLYGYGYIYVYVYGDLMTAFQWSDSPHMTCIHMGSQDHPKL